MDTDDRALISTRDTVCSVGGWGGGRKPLLVRSQKWGDGKKGTCERGWCKAAKRWGHTCGRVRAMAAASGVVNGGEEEGFGGTVGRGRGST